MMTGKPKTIKRGIESILFGSKWLLVPFYLGLIVALGVYCVINSIEVLNMLSEFKEMTEEKAMLTILKLVDMTMIAGLVKMIITGSYNSYISKSHTEETEKTSSGLLKVKMSTAIIGVSSIHMLQTFINAENTSNEIIFRQMWLHGSFLVGAFILAVIDYLHHKSEAIEVYTHHHNNSNNQKTEKTNEQH
jgi:uncharacterized protein (TIGR00645 family)